MTSERDDCIDRIVRAGKGKISRQEAMDALDELLSRAESKGPDWKQMDERLAEAAKEIEDAAMERASVMRRNERMDALKSIERHRFYARAPNPQLGLEAKLVGVNASFSGHRRSADYQYKAKRRELMGGFADALERDGLDRLFAARALEREWATELAELNKTKGGRPGITGSPEALKIAEHIRTFQKKSIDGINREGGWIKSYSGYITRTGHDPDRIRRAGGLKGDAARDRWIDDVLKHLDLERTFHDKDEAGAREKLKDLWKQFARGDHFDYSKPTEDLDGLIKLDIAKKASESRELHFKSADDWLAYNKLYNPIGPTAQVMYSFDRGARTYALLKEFGSKPREAFEEDIKHLKGKLETASPEAFQKFERTEPMLRYQFSYLDGSANRPLNRTAARLARGWLAWRRMIDLGLTPFVMLTDLATKSAALRWQDAPFFERWVGAFTGYFRGAKGSEKREVADLLLASVGAQIGDIAARFDGYQTPGGWLSRAENIFFKYTGIAPMTYNQRADAEVVMARLMGRNRGKDFDQLGRTARGRQRLQSTLQAYEIGRAEWDLLHKVDWHEFADADGVVTTYLTPDVAGKLADADLKAYLIEKGTLHKNAPDGPSVDFAIARAREDLADRLWTFFADQGEFAVLEPGAREHAKLFRGKQAGTPEQIALQILMQYKSFTAAMIMKTWGREIHGGQGRLGAVAGLAELFIASSILGVAANALNMTVKGQDPLSVWRDNPTGAALSGMLRGGAASIYGDFLLGQFSRHGQSALQSVAGPTFGQIDQLFEIYGDLTHMDAKRATAMQGLRFARRNAAVGMNTVYTRTAFDYLLFYRLQEAINPGYLRRHERAMKKNAGIEYWLRPTQVSR